MPKRRQGAAAADEDQQQLQQQQQERSGALSLEELDLSSDEEPLSGDADDEGEEGDAAAGGSGCISSGSGSEPEQQPDDSSSDEGEPDSEEAAADEDIQAALAEYLSAARQQQQQGGGEEEQEAGAAAAGNGQEEHADPASDSSEDERPNRNTIGDVPLEWYKDEEHIGYDQEGAKLLKSARGDRLDALLARNDVSGASLRTIYDAYNDEEITLSKAELAMIMRIRRGQFPHVEVNPYEPYIDYESSQLEVTPLLNAPEPKRRFVPSKWEEQKIVKLVRAIRKGWLVVGTKKEKRQARRAARQPQLYMMWGDDDQATEKSGSGLSYIPPAKPLLPGHAESYNPPAEYLPTEEEKAGWALLAPEERPSFVPQAFACLRHVPLYDRFINERFERCLDLYLCPRVRKKRLFINPATLVPQLPKPADLQPFPQTLALTFAGHAGRVRSISLHPGGQWLASGGDDGTLRLWEVATGRCCHTWQLGSSSSSSGAVEPVVCVAWCPDPSLQLLAAAVGRRLVLLPSGVGGQEVEAAARAACQVPADELQAAAAADAAPLARWVPRAAAAGGGLELVTGHVVRHMAWHARGDYLASVAPNGNTQAVLVHQLSRRSTQNPFRKNRGRVTRVAFHPTKPFFFVATQNAVRIYNLAKQALAKKLLGGSGVIACMAVHPSGDHVLLGSEDKRLAWFDLDLSTSPYKALRYHTYAVRGAAFHQSYPLFASASDDGTAHVFHGRVYADLMTNPLIVPVKILRGHKVVASSGVLDCAFHPTQPWLFTAGADGKVLLWCN